MSKNLIILFILITQSVNAKVQERTKVSDYYLDTAPPKKGKEYLELLEPGVDYGYLAGRVTDKRQNGKLIKIYTQHNNGKFLKAGDFVSFSLETQRNPNCFAIVRDTQDFYVTFMIKNFVKCTGGEKFIRSGTFVYIKSEILKKRVIEAARLRINLLKEKTALEKRKKNMTHFLWRFWRISLSSPIWRYGLTNSSSYHQAYFPRKL
jgi:hypothetical protein